MTRNRKFKGKGGNKPKVSQDTLGRPVQATSKSPNQAQSQAKAATRSGNGRPFTNNFYLSPFPYSAEDGSSQIWSSGYSERLVVDRKVAKVWIPGTAVGSQTLYTILLESIKRALVTKNIDKWNSTQIDQAITLALTSAQFMIDLRRCLEMKVYCPLLIGSDTYGCLPYLKETLDHILHCVVGPFPHFTVVPAISFAIADWFTQTFQITPAVARSKIDAIYHAPFGKCCDYAELTTLMGEYTQARDGIIALNQFGLPFRPISLGDLMPRVPQSWDSQLGLATLYYSPIAYSTTPTWNGETFGSTTNLVWHRSAGAIPQWYSMLPLFRTETMSPAGVVGWHYTDPKPGTGNSSLVTGARFDTAQVFVPYTGTPSTDYQYIRSYAGIAYSGVWAGGLHPDIARVDDPLVDTQWTDLLSVQLSQHWLGYAGLPNVSFRRIGPDITGVSAGVRNAGYFHSPETDRGSGNADVVNPEAVANAPPGSKGPRETALTNISTTRAAELEGEFARQNLTSDLIPDAWQKDWMVWFGGQDFNLGTWL